jgi:hypothetical protein
LNSDGIPDLAVIDGNGNAYILLGNGDGTFHQSARSVLDETLSSVAIRDLNGDGKADVVVAEQNTGSPLSDCPLPQADSHFSVFLGTGDGTLSAPTTYCTPSYGGVLAIGDLNGNQKPDLVFALGNVWVFLQPPNPTGPPTAPTITASDPPSPADANHPKLVGQAEDFSTVKLYKGGDCSGSPVATGSAAAFASPGLEVIVSDDTTTDFHATATNDAGTSPCSDAFTYVQVSRPPGPVGVTINDGDLFTNDPHVNIAAVWPKGTQRIVISNDGSFAHADHFHLDHEIPWTLRSSGAERLPKIVYVRFDEDTQTFSDDIILDETAPSVQQASLTSNGSGGTLSLEAKDSNSGVAKIQVRRGHHKPFLKLRVAKKNKRGKRKVARRFSVPAARNLSVRVFDAAGNRSHWKRVKR